MSPLSFLLVDDEKEFAETVVRRLRQRGFTAACVFSGTDAVMRLGKDDTIDVVILDILISKAEQAASRKKEREAKLLGVRMKPYLSKRERDELISKILAPKK